MSLECLVLGLYFSLFTLHSSLFTLHSSLFTLHSSLFTLHSSLFTLHSSLFTLHSSLFTLHSSLFTLPRLRRAPFDRMPRGLPAGRSVGVPDHRGIAERKGTLGRIPG